MRPFERRESGGFPYYRLATWDARALTWKDGKATFPTEAAARAAARAAGQYRVSRTDESGRADLEPYHVRPSRAKSPA